ncbi:MAG: histidinol-phosphate aminotransferase family protein [Candidatus Altiarchaeales archaeon]|nr:histidinol-phosphate aminotransferase family protein [Candidatus Altiarchaeota archaeon]MCG2782393.1 histidinol-phosphate aminotransferase family protein [Candidatus Altiarchaeales archaeon]
MKLKTRSALNKLEQCVHGSTTQDVLDFSTNTYPVRLPDEIIKVIEETIPQLGKYPETDSRKLREKIADYINGSSDNVIIGNGATELIRLISFCFPGNVFIPEPTYGEYEYSSRMYGSRIFTHRIPQEEEFLINEEILKFPSNTNLVFLCNPNNPTGRVIPQNLLLSFLEEIEGSDVLLMLDEAYYDISDSYTLIEKAAEFNNLIVLRSLKGFGLCGLRLGYAVANERVIEILDRTRPPWNVNAIAQRVGDICLNHPLLEKIRGTAVKSKEGLRKGLGRLPLRVYPSESNFFLINIKDTNYSSSQLTESLLNKGLYVRDCSSFHYLNEDYIRIGVKTPNDNRILIERLEEVLG